MPRRQFAFLAVALCSLLLSAGMRPCWAADSPAASKPSSSALTDRELALSRWFSQLTFLQDRTRKSWPEWHDDGEQLGVTSLRYQLAFAGYGCAAMAAKTPAYRELIAKQLGDLCQRMLDVRVWEYATHYWKYGDRPTDPCQYENVMYTGHLTQLMCLYELMTGDERYSREGWDFTSRDGRKVHYRLRDAIERLHVQSQANVHGGICCEPNLVFATCNSHSAASFLLFDLLHGTRYADVNAKWFHWMWQKFRIPTPGSTELFFLTYHQKHQVFVPAGDVGADCWTLGWGYPWFPSTDQAREGWKHLVQHARWQRPDAETLYAKNGLVVSCCGGGSLSVSNSFVPLVAVQVEGRDSPAAGKVLRWLEREFGRAVDLDGDGHSESYYYHTNNALRIATTGNIAAALATDGDSLRRLYRTPRRTLFTAPTLAHVDYPNVYVRAAEYVAPVLRFQVLAGRPGFSGKTEIVCTNVPRRATVLRDGVAFTDFARTRATLVIRTDLAREHRFEVAEWSTSR